MNHNNLYSDEQIEAAERFLEENNVNLSLDQRSGSRPPEEVTLYFRDTFFHSHKAMLDFFSDRQISILLPPTAVDDELNFLKPGDRILIRRHEFNVLEDRPNLMDTVLVAQKRAERRTDIHGANVLILERKDLHVDYAR